MVAGSNSADDIKVYVNGEAPAGNSDNGIVDVAQGHHNTAILTESGEVFVFGSDAYDVLQVPEFDTTVVELLEIDHYGVAARLADGSVVRWGDLGCPGESEWFNDVTSYEEARNYAIGINPDSSLTYIGCSNCGSHDVPAGNDYVGVWAGQWDRYWGGAIRENGEIEMWGCENLGNFDIPDSLGSVRDADGGYFWTVALMQDSTLRAWGYDGHGEISTMPELDNVIGIAAGYHFGLALTNDGTLHSWGYNGNGESSLPSFDGPVVKFGVGLYSGWAITESGLAYFWGYDVDNMSSDAEASQSLNSGFLSSIVVYQGTDVHALDLADFDGDGDLDVLSGGCDDQDVAWYANDGSAGFDGSRNLLAQDIGCVRRVLAVDIDVGWRPDVVTYASNGQLSWFENISQGNFGPQQLITSWGGGWDVESADLNNDGNPDLVIKANNGCFQWHKNPGPVGDWTFQQEQCPPTGNNTERAFVMADIIGDGGIDVVTSPPVRRRFTKSV